MIDDRPGFEQLRDVDPLTYAPSPATNDDASFAVSALIMAAILIIGGYFLVSYNRDTVHTASNAPVVIPPAPAPPAAPAPKQ